MVGGDGNGKLVGQIFGISAYVGDAGYMGDQYQARAELGTWYGYNFHSLKRRFCYGKVIPANDTQIH